MRWSTNSIDTHRSFLRGLNAVDKVYTCNLGPRLEPNVFIIAFARDYFITQFAIYQLFLIDLIAAKINYFANLEYFFITAFGTMDANVCMYTDEIALFTAIKLAVN